jgi:hypothetical protein
VVGDACEALAVVAEIGKEPFGCMVDGCGIRRGQRRIIERRRERRASGV